MRTTLTLDADVARTLEALVRQRKMTFKVVVNEALRAGLGLRKMPTPLARFFVKPRVDHSKNARKVNLSMDLATELDDEAVLTSMLRR